MTAANPKFTHVLRSADDTFMKFKIKPGSKDIHIFKLIPDMTTSSIKVIRRITDLLFVTLKMMSNKLNYHGLVNLKIV
jgi:hypothetical protein